MIAKLTVKQKEITVYQGTPGRWRRSIHIAYLDLAWSEVRERYGVRDGILPYLSRDASDSLGAISIRYAIRLMRQDGVLTESRRRNLRRRYPYRGGVTPGLLDDIRDEVQAIEDEVRG